MTAACELENGTFISLKAVRQTVSLMFLAKFLILTAVLAVFY